MRFVLSHWSILNADCDTADIEDVPQMQCMHKEMFPVMRHGKFFNEVSIFGTTLDGCHKTPNKQLLVQQQPYIGHSTVSNSTIV